ncbi:MAG TPA: MerR family transcriptional regulator [Burkholderiales bacterium]|nr:MerR family transcriptional regulator [Burkholderiales bacterium]
MAKYWTIKEFSKLTGITIRTLQYYDEENILNPHHKSDAGYRFYSSEDLQTIQKISVLKYIGFNLKQIKTILKTNQLDWLSSLNLQAKIIQDNIVRLNQGLILIKHSIDLYSKNNEIEWQSIAKMLEVFKMTHDNIVKEWSERNFSENEISFFAEMNFQQSKVDNEELWIKLFAEAKSLINKDPASHEVQNLAQKWMNSANNQYKDNPLLGKKMWELMKSGDIPKGLIPGYEQEIVLFMDKAIGILYKK